MEIHCSHINCNKVESVSTTDLQPIYPTNAGAVSDLIDAAGPTPASGGGFPYSIEDTIKCINEQLPTWEVYLEDNEHGSQTLKTVCSDHFKKENMSKLIADYVGSGGGDGGGGVSRYQEGGGPIDLVLFLIEIEAHLRTLAQESDKSAHYTLDLANLTKKIRLSRFDTTS